MRNDARRRVAGHRPTEPYPRAAGSTPTLLQGKRVLFDEKVGLQPVELRKPADRPAPSAGSRRGGGGNGGSQGGAAG